MMEEYYTKFPYERYCEPLIRKQIRRFGIKAHQIEYQECYSAAMESYMYSIAQCALHNYNYVENYIKKMIKVTIICVLVIVNENCIICREHGFKQIELNSEGMQTKV